MDGIQLRNFSPYMLKSLASHLLAPERLPTKGQTFASHLAVLIDETQGPHLKVLASCLRAILGLKDWGRHSV
eukprot:s449_g19.t1